MESDGKIYKTKMIILFNVVLITFMSSLDSSIVNVALPKMAVNLSVTTEAVTWIITSYLIAILGTILIFGRLGDLKGKFQVFNYGIVLFTFGSLLCAVSNSLYLLIGARVIQGIGASATMATSHGIITQVFPVNERGKSLGLNGTFVALGSMAGPPLGGFIIDILNWKYIFLINIPIGIAAFIIAMKFLPKSYEKSNEKLDWSGAVLFALASVFIFGSLILGQDFGYDNHMIILVLTVGLISFIVFIITENKLKQPLLQLNIFKNRLFSLNIFCAFLSFIGISCSLYIQPFYLQNAMNFSPTQTGIIIMTFPIVLSVAAPFSGYLADKIGSEVLTLPGLALTSLAFFLMSGLNEHSSLPVIIIYMVILSIGNGLFQSPNNALVMSNVSKDMLGIAGSINALIRNLGLILGVSLSIMILYGRMSAKIGYHVSNYIQGRADLFIYGMQGIYMAAGLICAAGAFLTAVRLYHKMKKAK